MPILLIRVRLQRKDGSNKHTQKLMCRVHCDNKDEYLGCMDHESGLVVLKRM